MTNQNTEHRIVLDAFLTTASKLEKRFQGNKLTRETLKLAMGAVRYAKVEGVRTIQQATNFIRSIGEHISTMNLKDGTRSYRFVIPASYSAVSPLAKISDVQTYLHNVLKQDKELPIGHLVVIDRMTAKGLVQEQVLHNPLVKPLPTTTVTFKLTQDCTELVEWFPGDEKCMFTASVNGDWLDLSRYYMYVGNSAVKEAKRALAEHFQNTH